MTSVRQPVEHMADHGDPGPAGQRDTGTGK